MKIDGENLQMAVVLKTFDEVFLKLSWKWLSDPEIKSLTDTGDITQEKQQDWFNSLAQRKDYLIWGVEANSIPVGACGLKNIKGTDCEYWGYIGEKSYWGKGIGTTILDRLSAKARDLGITSIWLRVIKENHRAISLYKMCGYIIESETDTVLLMRKTL